MLRRSEPAASVVGDPIVIALLAEQPQPGLSNGPSFGSLACARSARFHQFRGVEKQSLSFVGRPCEACCLSGSDERPPERRRASPTVSGSASPRSRPRSHGCLHPRIWRSSGMRGARPNTH